MPDGAVAANPAWHRRKQQRRSSARITVAAFDSLLRGGLEPPSKLVKQASSALPILRNHHGSCLPGRVSAYFSGTLQDHPGASPDLMGDNGNKLQFSSEGWNMVQGKGKSGGKKKGAGPVIFTPAKVHQSQ